MKQKTTERCRMMVQRWRGAETANSNSCPRLIVSMLNTRFTHFTNEPSNNCSCPGVWLCPCRSEAVNQPEVSLLHKSGCFGSCWGLHPHRTSVGGWKSKFIRAARPPRPLSLPAPSSFDLQENLETSCPHVQQLLGGDNITLISSALINSAPLGSAVH